MYFQNIEFNVFHSVHIQPSVWAQASLLCLPPSLPHLTDSRLIWEDYVNGGFSLLPTASSLPCFTPNRASQFLRHARRRSRQRGQWWASKGKRP